MIYALSAIVVYLSVELFLTNKQHDSQLKNLDGFIENLLRRDEKKEAEWNIERQQLLDRIQAPSYDHLKHHEANIIKASKEPLKETTTLEVV